MLFRLWCSAAAGPAAQRGVGSGGRSDAAGLPLPLYRALLWPWVLNAEALPRKLCSVDRRPWESCRAGGVPETAAGGRGSSKNPSNSTFSYLAQ
jgi:hypothetical protein